MHACMYVWMDYVFSPICNLESSYPFSKTQPKVPFSMILAAHASKFLHDVKTYLLCPNIYIFLYLTILIC